MLVSRVSTNRIIWTKECDTKCDHTEPFLLKWAAFCDRVDCSIIPRIAPQDPIKGGKLSMNSLPPEHRICDFWCSFLLKSGRLECSAKWLLFNLCCVFFNQPARKMILGFLWEYSTAFSASELLPQVSPQPEFLPVSRNISLTGSISLAAKSFHIFVLFPLSLQLQLFFPILAS